jgi:8-oxo-dGTP pyrophosphatase MutT (NUDIX family)
MFARLAAVVLLAAGLRGCVAYEYEHEFWMKVDGSGSVYVTGRPELWRKFKGLQADGDDADALRAAARALFERAGLRVRRVTVTHRGGRAYLFLSADFEDINRLSSTAAFPDLQISLRPQGERLRLEGRWSSPARPPGPPVDSFGVMAVRFHLPSKVYGHDNAAGGVERGNIVAWKQEVARALAGDGLAFGATLDSRSILWSTVGLFAAAIATGLGIIAAALFLVFRRGRRAQRTAA